MKHKKLFNFMEMSIWNNTERFTTIMHADGDEIFLPVDRFDDHLDQILSINNALTLVLNNGA